jgi:hypothetical protein
VKQELIQKKRAILAKYLSHVKTKGYRVLSLAGTISFGASGVTPALFGACTGAGVVATGTGVPEAAGVDAGAA